MFEWLNVYGNPFMPGKDKKQPKCKIIIIITNQLNNYAAT